MIILMITFYINKDIVIYYIILYYGTYSLSPYIYIYITIIVFILVFCIKCIIGYNKLYKY